MSDWFDTGPFVPEPLTKRQRWRLVKDIEKMLELLTHEERVAVELMGAEEWIDTLSKWDATRLIDTLKGAEVAEAVRDREAETARQAIDREPGAIRRRWFTRRR